MTKCSALACNKAAGTFSPLCSSHKSRLRKQGHEEQRGITLTEMRPFLQMVRDRRMRNPDNAVWPILITRWQRLADESRGILNTYEAGLPMILHKKLAADEVIRLTTTADVQEVVDAAVAMFVMLEIRPRAFMSNKAFKFQLVRRVLRVTKANAVTYVGSDRPKKAYRDVPPKTADVMAQWLIEAFGATGVTLGRIEKTEVHTLIEEKRSLEGDLETLQ